jgi:integrase
MPRKKRDEGTRAPNGASTVYLGTDGYWHGRVSMGTKDDGTPNRPHVKRKTEAEAIKAVRALEKKRDSGEAHQAGRGWTVEQWLTHWVENVAPQTVRRTTMVGYRASVYKHLIPGIGAHRLAKLEPEHLERLYVKLLDWRHGCREGKSCGKRRGDECPDRWKLKPGTVHLAHRTVRVALGEAVKRKRITSNPAKVAKPPRVVEEEIVPFTTEEAQRILTAAETTRNGARYKIALALGLRRGEALGLKWSDLIVTWQHGCRRTDECRSITAPQLCERRKVHSATLTIRRAIQQFVWQHGCPENKPCGHKYGAHCPQRHGGGVVVTEVKSRAGKRTIGVPDQLVAALERHREKQAVDQARAAELWHDEGWMFSNHVGLPVHPTVDHEAWKALLRRANVRSARLHDARHTAATMLLVLKVPLPAVMEIMGWTDAGMAKRYMHVPNELAVSIGQQVGDLLWSTGGRDAVQDRPAARLTAEQRAAVRQLAKALPAQFGEVLELLADDGDDDGPAGVPVPA